MHGDHDGDAAAPDGDDGNDDEIVAIIRQVVAHAAKTDPQRRRFGARQHGYRWWPPLSVTRTIELERAIGVALPAGYRRFVTRLGDGGCGPYHGLLPFDHPIQLAAAQGTFDPAAREGRALYRGVIGLGHVGCAQIAMLVVRGDAAGQVWVDTRGADGRVTPIAPSFDAYCAAWIDAIARNQWPRTFSAPSACATPGALSRFLAAIEHDRGIAPGTLTAAQTADALRKIVPGSLTTTSFGGDPFFDRGDPVDLCPSCASLLDRLGLPQETAVAGKKPLMEGRSLPPIA